MKYKPAAEREEAVSNDRKFEDALMESIGTVAADPAPLAKWNTAYCIYDKFDENDEYDENFDCAVRLTEYYRGRISPLFHLVQTKFLRITNGAEQNLRQHIVLFPVRFSKATLMTQMYLLTKAEILKVLLISICREMKRS